MMVSASLGRSRLHRLLSDWSSPPTTGASTDAARLWASWLQPLQAVQLQAGLDAVEAAALAAPQPPSAGQLRGFQLEVDRIRGAWQGAVDPAELAPDEPAAVAAVEARWPGHAALSGFDRYRRVHLEWQRQMAAMVDPLRAQVRRAWARAGGRWQRLASLDVLVESLLQVPDARAMAQLPAWLQVRYDHWMADGSSPGEGITHFFADWQALVDAELELRLQPVQGLLDDCLQDTL